MQIATKYGVSYPTIALWTRRFGIEGSVRPTKPLDVARLRELAKTRTTTELAVEFGVVYATVSLWCRTHGIKPKRRTRKDVYSCKSRMFQVLASLMKTSGQRDVDIATVHSCTREYVGQIRAMAVAHGLITNP